MTYIVQPGDSLWSIAQRYGVTVQAIASANGIMNPHTLAVGQTLYIPTPGSPSVAAPGTDPSVPSPGTAAIGERLNRLEREFSQLVTVVDHHRQQIADLDRRLRKLER